MIWLWLVVIMIGVICLLTVLFWLANIIDQQDRRLKDERDYIARRLREWGR